MAYAVEGVTARRESGRWNAYEDSTGELLGSAKVKQGALRHARKALKDRKKK